MSRKRLSLVFRHGPAVTAEDNRQFAHLVEMQQMLHQKTCIYRPAGPCYSDDYSPVFHIFVTPL